MLNLTSKSYINNLKKYGSANMSFCKWKRVLVAKLYNIADFNELFSLKKLYQNF